MFEKKQKKKGDTTVAIVIRKKGDTLFRKPASKLAKELAKKRKRMR